MTQNVCGIVRQVWDRLWARDVRSGGDDTGSV